MTQNGENITVVFQKYNHFWLDSGLIGFYVIASDLVEEYQSVKINLDRSSVTLHGNEIEIQALLHHCMQQLLDSHYNISTEKQRQERSGIYYDSEAEKFVRFPKVKTQGISSIIFSKAPRPLKNKAKYDKKNRLITDNKYNYLNERLNQFLEEENLKIESANILIGAPNAYQPKYFIDLEIKNRLESCFICGSSSNKLSELKGTAFPLITGDAGIKSFFSFSQRPEKICWKCDYLSRFVPVNGFYKRLENDGMMTFFPYSNNLKKLWKEFGKLEVTKQPNEYYSLNFIEYLGGYFQKAFESSFSFFYSLYKKVLIMEIADDSEDIDSFLFGQEFDRNLSEFVADDFVDFHLLELIKLGDSFIGKTSWPYNDMIYFFRLLKEIEINRNIRIKRVMHQLIDFDQTKNENKTIIRNKVCERILKKRKIIDLIEPFVFTVNKNNRRYFYDLYKFTIEYEHIICGGNNKMNEHAREVAVKLGQQIGGAAGSDSRNLKRGKGDLFKLRKTRTVPDFLEELNRIQFRYGINITKNLYEGIITKQNYREFKQYVLIAALNTYNGKMGTREKVTANE